MVTQQDSTALWLPKLKCLKSLESAFKFATFWQIYDYYVVSVDVNSLVTDNELLVPCSMAIKIGRYGHGGISNLKQMTPHCNELKSTRITSIELGEEEPNSWALLVGENIEALIFRVVKQWYDIGYVE